MILTELAAAAIAKAVAEARPGYKPGIGIWDWQGRPADNPGRNMLTAPPQAEFFGIEPLAEVVGLDMGGNIVALDVLAITPDKRFDATGVHAARLFRATLSADGVSLAPPPPPKPAPKKNIPGLVDSDRGCRMFRVMTNPWRSR